MKLTDPISAAGGVVGGEFKLSKIIKTLLNKRRRKFFSHYFENHYLKWKKGFSSQIRLRLYLVGYLLFGA